MSAELNGRMPDAAAGWVGNQAIETLQRLLTEAHIATRPSPEAFIFAANGHFQSTITAACDFHGKATIVLQLPDAKQLCQILDGSHSHIKIRGDGNFKHFEYPYIGLNKSELALARRLQDSPANIGISADWTTGDQPNLKPYTSWKGK